MKLDCIVTCPECNYKSTETMPITFCQILFHCKHCNSIILQLKGDCCIFCSYGDTPCPSMQKDN